MIRKNASWIGIGALVVILVIAVVGFGGNSSDTDAGTGIPIQDPELVTAGEPLYQASCASCHGTDLRGTDKGPSHLSVVYE
ncbi:MAG: cytochrome c, partial [Actinomycetota bacterium]